MFLVKSCSQRYNIPNSKTVKIGTLHEYRETESLQILDKEEGFLISFLISKISTLKLIYLTFLTILIIAI